jgi:hypothetical protein
MSYIWLIATPLDLKMAHDQFMLPNCVTWTWWKAFVKDVVSNVDINTLSGVNKRYQFGTLRLDRINSIYRSRFIYSHFIRGYWQSPAPYVPFFERSFSWVLIPFVFLSLILSAMQVGISLHPLENNHAFLQASYGIVLFAMISVFVLVSSVLTLYLIRFLFNVAVATRHARIEQARRKRASRAKRADGTL